MSSNSSKKPYDNVEFDWIQLSADIDPNAVETFYEKTKRKFSENPFVPIGECVICDAKDENLKFQQKTH